MMTHAPGDAEWRSGWLAVTPITGTQAVLHPQVASLSLRPSRSPYPLILATE